MFSRDPTRNTRSAGRYIAVFLMATAACTLSARSQSTYQPEKAPAWRYKVPASPTVDTRTPAQIRADDQYFDTYFGNPDPLDGPQTHLMGRSGPGEVNADFPTRLSDEIVVAHFSTWSSHLTSSRHSIYTIVNLQIDRVVTDKDGKLKAGETLPLLIPGGTVRVPGTGKTLSYFWVWASYFPLEPNSKYLIFLAHRFLGPEPPYHAYAYVKAWNVDKGILRPASAYDAARVSAGLSKHNGESLEDAIRDLTSH